MHCSDRRIILRPLLKNLLPLSAFEYRYSTNKLIHFFLCSVNAHISFHLFALIGNRKF
uniref:Uncharacterized protein n=1 Tax=Ascaris lumbricoides TaxID=6252 RepID=A0A0M3IH87_ASCLU